MIFEKASNSDKSVISESSTIYEEYPSENFQLFAKRQQAPLNGSTNVFVNNKLNYSTSYKALPADKLVSSRQTNNCDFGVLNSFQNFSRNLKMQNNFQDDNFPVSFRTTVPSVMPFTQQQNQVLNQSRALEQNKILQRNEKILLKENEEKNLLHASNYNLLFPDNYIVDCFPQNKISRNNLNCQGNEGLKPARNEYFNITPNLMADITALNQQSAIFNNGIMGIQPSAFQESHCETKVAAGIPQINYDFGQTTNAAKSPILSGKRAELSSLQIKKSYSKNMMKSSQEILNSATESPKYQLPNTAVSPFQLTSVFTEKAKMSQDLIPTITQRSLVTQKLLQINKNQDNNLNTFLKDKTSGSNSHGLLSNTNQSTNDTLSASFTAKHHLTNTFQFLASQRLNLIYNEERDKRDQAVMKRRTALKKRFFSCYC